MKKPKKIIAVSCVKAKFRSNGSSERSEGMKKPERLSNTCKALAVCDLSHYLYGIAP